MNVVIPTAMTGVLLATGSLFHPAEFTDTWFIAQVETTAKGGGARWGPQSLMATGASCFQRNKVIYLEIHDSELQLSAIRDFFLGTVEGKGALMQCGGGNQQETWDLDQRQASGHVPVNQPFQQTVSLE